MFLLGKKGFISLKYLLEKESDYTSFIAHVAIAKDLNLDKDYSEEIENLCIQYDIPYKVGHKFTEEMSKVHFGIAIGWRWLIDCSIIKLIVFHDSILPKYRGFNPLVTALIEGDRNIGATALFGDKNFDSGDIIIQKTKSIEYPIKIEQAINIISEIYGQMLLEIFHKIKIDNLNGVAQDHQKATYSLWRNEEDYFVNWNDSAKKIKRFIDSTSYPYKGACTDYNGKLIRIVETEIVDDVVIINRKPGKIMFLNDNVPTVVCGTGLLKIQQAFDETTEEQILFKRLRVRLH